MRVVVVDGEAEAAAAAADVIASCIRESPGPFPLAVSGGRTPMRMFALLAEADVAWDRVSIFQVDERVAPEGAEARNLTGLRSALLDRLSVRPPLFAMPVDDPDLEAASRRYEEALRASGPLDLVHLGLGSDGHTASLVPGDPALDITGALVTATAPHQGHRRMTLTLPALNDAGLRVWLVAGGDKAEALGRLVSGDRSIPAARVRSDASILIADREAARLL